MSTPAEIQSKYQSSSSFRKQMDKSNEDYVLLVQQAHYLGQAGINPLVITPFDDKTPSQVDKFFIFGAYQEEGAKASEKLTLYFVTKIPRPKRPYILIYFNSATYPNGFSDFKNIISLMPIEYIVNLQKIILVRPSLRNKAFKLFSFSTVAKYLNNITVTVEDIEEVAEVLNSEPDSIFHFLPYDVRKKFEEEEKKSSKIRQTNIESALTSLVSASAGRTTEGLTKSKVALVKKKDIEEFAKSERGVPQIFQLFIFALKDNRSGLEEEGIFRKAASIEDELELLDKMMAGDYEFLNTVKNPHVVGNALKKFLAKLESPLIPYEQFENLMAPSHLTPQIVAAEMKKMGQSHLTNLLTLMVLVDFLKNDVIPLQSTNKMTEQNISICFAPCLLWAPERSIKDIVYATKSVQVVSLMITHSEQIFGSHRDQKNLYRSSYLQQKKKSIAQTYTITEETKLDPQLIKEAEKKEESRDRQNCLTPYFGQLILNKALMECEAMSESSVTEEGNVELKMKQSEIKKPFPPKDTPPRPPAELKKVEEKSQGQTNMNQLEVPQKMKRGIFSSHLGPRIGMKKSTSKSKSNRSNKSINSIHSDV